jgi:hypothetical protein
MLRKHIKFSTIDPLANGLDDEIAAERREPEAIRSLDDIPAEDLSNFWGSVLEEVKKDPGWFDYSQD